MAVAPKLNVVEQAAAGLLASCIATVHTLGFEGGVEALHHGVIVGVARAAHADLDTMLSQWALIVPLTLAELSLTSGIVTAAGYLWHSPHPHDWEAMAMLFHEAKLHSF